MVDCGCGSRHWGRYGAAGVLAFRNPDRDHVLLQHRAHWTLDGGTWGIPGGALHAHEHPIAGAAREATEELSLEPGARVRATHRLAHPDWSYTTLVAEASAGQQALVANPESLDAQWVAVGEVGNVNLMPAFRSAWPTLRELARPIHLVCDIANIMGSVPDGWWRDPHGAAARFLTRINEALSDRGLPAAALSRSNPARDVDIRYFPDVTAVVEGKARDAEPEHTADPALGMTMPIVAMRSAPYGDDAIVEATHSALESGANTVVITSDRELSRRVVSIGATVIGSGVFRKAFER